MTLCSLFQCHVFLSVTAVSDELSVNSLQARIHRHLSVLVRFIEPDFRLLDELMSMDVLDEMEIADVRARANIYEKNNRLLQYFVGKPDDVCQQFLTALMNTKQQHIVNFIEHDGS